MFCPLSRGVVHQVTEEVAMEYGLPAVRWAMTIPEVMLRAIRR
jgi:hypothetical protein